uniref:Chitin synthase regulator n=1 Tax=Siphoviridae sp. ct2vX3 TaxID=2825318 RepID=A0A8S5PZ87_9CAUD|nr:MAG TPA: chitin synthase regulator [Siphoviridae sp. ct2vX3]
MTWRLLWDLLLVLFLLIFQKFLLFSIQKLRQREIMDLYQYNIIN